MHIFEYYLTIKLNVMTTEEIASRFNELAQSGNWDKIQDELYADNAVSIEPAHAQGLQSVEGMQAIKQKGEMFNNMIQEVHSGYSKEPQIAGNHFSVAMGMDLTMKDGNRMQMDEIAVYEVKDGKIVKEQFFF
jgi:ketosteroid isomerase-like protein